MESSQPANLRKAETDIIEALTTRFKTPGIVSKLKELCQRERKIMSAANNNMAEKIVCRVMEEEAAAAVEKSNEEEKARAEWVACKNMAEAASASAAGVKGHRGRKSKYENDKERNAEGVKGQRGRKRKYENDEDRKAARREAAKKRRATNQGQKGKGGPGQVGAMVLVEEEQQNPADGALVLVEEEDDVAGEPLCPSSGSDDGEWSGDERDK